MKRRKPGRQQIRRCNICGRRMEAWKIPRHYARNHAERKR